MSWVSALAQRVAEWVSAGIITAEQAEAIKAFEQASGRPAGISLETPHETQDSRAALVVEVLGYLGGALALAAVAFVVSQMWDALGDIGQVLVVGGATAGLLAAGALLRLAEQEPIKRLARFLWFLAVGGVAATVGLIIDMTTSVDDERMLVPIAGTALVVGLVLWWFERRALQQIAVFVAAMYLLFGSLVGYTDLGVYAYAWISWGVGLAWLIASRFGLLPPRTTGYALASIALIVSPLVATAEGDASLGMLGLGVVTALALLGAALLTEERMFLGFGALGILIYVPQIAFEIFGEDALAVPIVLLATGLSLIGVAVMYARMRRRTPRDDPSV